MTLILASASPRRAELLTSAGFTFVVEPADVDETPHKGEDATTYALRVALDKARTVHRARAGSATSVLAADTVVVSDGEILAKPENAADARRMLRLLSGVVHDVHTAVVLLGGPAAAGAEHTEVVTTRVRFTRLTEDEIEWYVRSGEAEGKAGAYGIQGRAARFIDWIEGSWSNVVGLPVATVYSLLRRAEPAAVSFD